MSKYDSDYPETQKREKHKAPKFRDYEKFDEENERALHAKKKKLDKKNKRKKNPDPDWPAEEPVMHKTGMHKKGKARGSIR
jgi:hypothetical protein